MLRHRDGRLAARFWLDTATKLPLRRETYDRRAQLVSEDVFMSLKLGSPAARGGAAQHAPRPGASRWPRRSWPGCGPRAGRFPPTFPAS